jgi:hypothetical protein
VGIFDDGVAGAPEGVVRRLTTAVHRALNHDQTKSNHQDTKITKAD